MITDKKIEGSAARVAAKLSRLLRVSGFEKAGPKFRSEGFFVRRVGYSSTVHVGYHIPNDNDRTTCKSKIAQMREALFECGYISKHPHGIYIDCTRP